MSHKEEALKREKELKKELIPNPNIGEMDIFTGFASLYKIVPNQMKAVKIGNGMAQILIDKKTQRSRLLMRNHKDLNSKVINCYILHELKRCSETHFQFDAIDADEVNKETYEILFLNLETATKFKNVYMNAFCENIKLLNKK